MRLLLLLVTVAFVLPLNAQDHSKPTNPHIEATACVMLPVQLEVALPKLDSFESAVARKTTSADRKREFHGENVNEFTLKDVSVDGYIFGLRAVGREATATVVRAHVNPPRGKTVNKVAPQ